MSHSGIDVSAYTTTSSPSLPTIEYTGMSRLAARTENGTRVEFSYDTEEDLRGIINEDGYAYRFERDALGRVVEERAFDGLAQTYVRDPAGQVVAVIKPGGG